MDNAPCSNWAAFVMEIRKISQSRPFSQRSMHRLSVRRAVKQYKPPLLVCCTVRTARKPPKTQLRRPTMQSFGQVASCRHRKSSYIIVNELESKRGHRSARNSSTCPRQPCLEHRLSCVLVAMFFHACHGSNSIGNRTFSVGKRNRHEPLLFGLLRQDIIVFVYLLVFLVARLFTLHRG